MKKFLPFVLLLMLAIPFLPLQNASAYTGGYLNGKPAAWGSSFGSNTTGSVTKVTDNNETTSEILYYAGSHNYFTYNLSTPVSINSYQLKAASNNGLSIIIKQSNGTISVLDNLNISSQKTKFNQIDNVVSVALTNSSTSGINISEFDLFTSDTIPPSEVTDFTFDSTLKWFKWKNPSDLDFAGTKIYMNNVLQYDNTLSNKSNTSANWGSLPKPGELFVIKTIDNSGNLSTGVTYGIPVDTSPPINVTQLKATPTEKTLKFDWTAPTDTDFDHYEIYFDGMLQNNTLTGNTITFSDLTEGTPHTIKVISVDKTGNKSSGSSLQATTTIPDRLPPKDILSLTHTETTSSVSFSFDLPPDDDFSHFEIYQNDKLIESDYTSKTFDVTDLTDNTPYFFRFVSVDKSGNKSSGYGLTVTTKQIKDETPPAPVKDIKVEEFNQAVKVTWDKSPETDILGYDIYVDGKKINENPVLKNEYVLNGLENGKNIEIVVVPVDKSGNVGSIPDTPVLATPDKSKMPLFKTNVELKDVSTSISAWFGSFWPILAFAVGLSLAFYIGFRIKQLFIA